MQVMASNKQPVSDVLCANMNLIVAAYRKATGVAMATVSSKFYGHPSALKSYLAGKTTISTKKYDALRNAILEKWPEGVAWPFEQPFILERPRKR